MICSVNICKEKSMILLTNMEVNYSTFVHVPQVGSIVCTCTSGW